ncbi:hypothetical protein KBC55_03010 [Patescibacteria group bacterium]|nr:hypothetical protein [Patescibacteria group bacterium]
MQHVLYMGKRAFSAAIAAATIAFSVGAGALVSPSTAHAATAGDLIKGTSLSTVYYYGYDGMRYTFPNETTYMTWFTDFSGVMTISDSSLSAITLGGNVVMRPGSYWVKVQSDPKTYAVARNGMIHWIESEAVAVGLAGADWASRIVDVADVFFTDYSVGPSLMSSEAYEGMLYEMGGDTYLVWDGEMLMVTANGMTANGFQNKFVMDGSSIDDSALSMGDDVTGELLALVDVAQTETDMSGNDGVMGDLMISEASSMPVGTTLPKGANSVAVFSFEVEADTDGELDNIALKLIGAGSTSNIENVYLYEGNTRLTEARSVNASTRMVTFNNLNLAVDAGDSRVLTARVEVSTSATAADTFGFQIASAGDVVASGDVDGSFPVAGNIFTLSGSSAGTAVVKKNGSISDPTLGEQDADIAEFKIEAGSEPVSVESITLKVEDAADHSDFQLYDGSAWLAEGEDIGGDYVLFDLSSDPFMIEDGDSNIFKLTADIGGQAQDEIKVYVDDAVDVVAIGDDFGFGVAVDTDSSGTYDGASCTSSSGNCSYSEIQGGDVTLAFNGPSAGDLQIDGDDQSIFEFSITASQEITIKDLDVLVYGDDDADNDPFDGAEAGGSDNDGLLIGTSEGALEDIKIVNADTGAVLMGPVELSTSGNDAVQTLGFNDDFTVEAGETLNLAVTADLNADITSGTEFGATLDLSGLEIEDENGDELVSSDIVPSSDLVGFSHTAKSASLAFTLSSTPSDTTTVQGSDNVGVVGFTATAGDASEVTVTDLTLAAYGDDDNSGGFTAGGEAASDVNDFIESCSLYQGDTLVAGPEAPTTNGQSISFDDFAWTIAAGQSENVSVMCNLANPSDASNRFFALDINDAATDVVAEDNDGDSIDASGTDVNGGTTPTTVLTVAASGTLAITVGSDTPSADFVMSSSSMNHVATYRFTATNEGFDVKTLTLSEEEGEDNTGVSESTAYTNNISLVTIEYPNAAGTMLTATASMSGNEAKFSNLSFHVPTGSPEDVKVYVNVPLTDRDSGGSATSNEKIRMGLFADTTNDDNFRATGIGSGETLDDDNLTVLGDDSTDGIKTFVVRESKPTVTLSSASPSGSAVPGRSEVYRFNVAASSNEDVVLDQLVFTMTSTANNSGTWNICDANDGGAGNMQASDFDLYNLTVDGTSQTLDAADGEWSLLTTDGTVCTDDTDVVKFAKLDLATSEVVPAGSSYTFSLYFDSTGASSNDDDSIRFDIGTDPIVSTFITASDLTESNLTATDTTISVTSGAAYLVGDVVCMDTADNNCGATDEKMLVTGIATNDLTVVRGYLGTYPDSSSANDAGDDLDRMPSSFFWKDDGSTTSTTANSWWGSYLVDNITLNGNTLVF